VRCNEKGTRDLVSVTRGGEARPKIEMKATGNNVEKKFIQSGWGK